MKQIANYFLLCIVLVLLSYFFIDQPLAKVIYSNKLYKIPFFHWAIYIPNVLVYISAFALLLVLAIAPFNLSNSRLQTFVLAIALSNYATIILVKSLKFIFGRIGPKYWAKHHFHLHDYGFYWFHGNLQRYQDFPSGHTAVTFAMLGLSYYFFPRLRWLSILVSLLVIVALLMTQNHFMADCIAGAFLGLLVSFLTLSALKEKTWGQHEIKNP